MRLTSFAITHKGRLRSSNQDNFYVNGFWKDNTDCVFLEWKKTCWKKQQIYAVCDGMGGEVDGEKASLAAVRVLAGCQKKFRLAADFKKWSESYIKSVSDFIIKMEGDSGRVSGTTLALLAFDGKKSVLVCNVGDSRVYHFHKGCLRLLTRDHTTAYVMEGLCMVKAGDGRKYSCGNTLLQYIGIHKEEMIIEPYYQMNLNMEEGDIFILCSDGLTDMVEEQAICRTLSGTETLEYKGKRLLKQALDYGGRDNVTVILVQTGAEPLKRLGRLRKWKQYVPI